MIKPLFCFLLVVLVLTSGFSYPMDHCGQTKSAATCAKANDKCMMAKQCKHAPCNQHKKDKSGQTLCSFCILCVAFVVPFKPDTQRHFATGSVEYAQLLQSKLTDFNTSPWRPPAA
jgi:hypothetical protein